MVTVSKIQMILDVIRDSGILGEGLKKTDSYAIIYQRENGRYMKPDFKISMNQTLELEHIGKYDSALVINLKRALSNI